jgi:hypothetical protein
MLPRRPRFVYGNPVVTFTPSIPQDPWIPPSRSVGGVAWSMARQSASFVVRRDGDLDLTVRFHEWEWPAFLDWLHFAQTAAPFTFYPDANEATSYQAFLVSPHYGEDPIPQRIPGYAPGYQLPVVIRKQGTAVAFDHPFIVSVAPTACFTSIVVDLGVTFSALCSTPGQGATITNYAFDFGDSNSDAGSGTAFAHTYAGPGTYTVTLIVTNSRGLIDTFVQDITVTAPAPLGQAGFIGWSNQGWGSPR